MRPERSFGIVLTAPPLARPQYDDQDQGDPAEEESEEEPTEGAAVLLSSKIRGDQRRSQSEQNDKQE